MSLDEDKSWFKYASGTPSPAADVFPNAIDDAGQVVEGSEGGAFITGFNVARRILARWGEWKHGRYGHQCFRTGGWMILLR